MLTAHDFNLDNHGGMMSASGTIAFCMLMLTIGTLIAGADLRCFGWKPDFAEHRKLILLAWLLPTFTQLLGAVFYYRIFPDEFDMTGIFLQETNPEAFKELENSRKSYASYVIKQIFYSFTSPRVVISMLLGLGEEIGWRGFLFPRLKEKKVEYLELIYDLIFVYIIGRNNALLHHTENGFVTQGMFLAYFICMLAVIQIWNFTTFYINLYGRNRTRDHVFLFFQTG